MGEIRGLEISTELDQNVSDGLKDWTSLEQASCSCKS